jgi:hypothetical protein
MDLFELGFGEASSKVKNCLKLLNTKFLVFKAQSKNGPTLNNSDVMISINRQMISLLLSWIVLHVGQPSNRLHMKMKSKHS